MVLSKEIKPYRASKEYYVHLLKGKAKGIVRKGFTLFQQFP